MKIAALNSAPVFVEIGPDVLRARQGSEGTEVPLERSADGRLTGPGKEKAIAALKEFLKSKGWQRPQAWCAISSRGVSFRQLTLPGGTKEEFHERLLLQIESEFPLPPDELAWGYQPVGRSQPSNGVLPRQDLLVAAVKKGLVMDFQEILRACGTDPLFTLAAMARWNAAGQPANSFAMLDIGATQSELTIFENGAPTTSRIVFWDGENISAASEAQLQDLARSIKGSLVGSRLLVSGSGVSPEFVERLERALAHGWKCERLESPQAIGNSAAIAGLEKFAAQGSNPSLVIRLESAVGTRANFGNVDWKTWGTRIGALALAALLLPYAEALLLKPHLEKKVAAFQTESERLKVIDRELDFLRDLKLSQPPYLDLLYVFSKSVPPGTHFDSLFLNSHGEVSLRCAFRDGQQVADFRNKLIASGFFTNVVVEEQLPTPDRQRVNVRMSAQENTAAQLQMASARLVVDDPAKAGKDGKPPLPGGPSPSPGMPSVLPGGPPIMPSAPPVTRKDSK